jgi:hypothetical protein
MLPVSWVINDAFVGHTNPGATRTPEARNTLGEKAISLCLSFEHPFIKGK